MIDEKFYIFQNILYKFIELQIYFLDIIFKKLFIFILFQAYIKLIFQSYLSYVNN